MFKTDIEECVLLSCQVNHKIFAVIHLTTLLNYDKIALKCSHCGLIHEYTYENGRLRIETDGE